MIDFPVSQAKQTAELLCAFRELQLTDAYHGRTVMGHDYHLHLHDSTLQTFVTDVPRAPREQTGDVTFHHWSAVAAGKGEVHLMWRAFAVQAWSSRRAASASPQTSSWVGAGGIGATVWGIPTVRIPRTCRASRRAVSLTPRSPATEWIASRRERLTQSMALWTFSIMGKT